MPATNHPLNKYKDNIETILCKDGKTIRAKPVKWVDATPGLSAHIELIYGPECNITGASNFAFVPAPHYIPLKDPDYVPEPIGGGNWSIRFYGERHEQAK